MKKRIAFFQNEFTVGGIQKSLLNLLTNFDYDRFEVDLYLFSKDNYWESALPKELNVIYLKPVSKLLSFLPFDMAKAFIRPDLSGVREYDVAIDFNSYQNCCAVGAIKAPAKKRVMWVHNDVGIKLREEWKYKLLWTLFKGKFKYFDEFVTVSDGLIEPFMRESGVKDKKITPIQNYISIKEITEKLSEEPEDLALSPDCMNFVALGRLCHQKGYDIMIDYFASAIKERDDLRLYIIGDGEDRQALLEQIESRGLSQKITLLGNQKNPFCYMKHMDAFISTSRYEGQGMNIMEAMVVGLPLYCTKNLEKYVPGLVGREDMVAALKASVKEEKKPDLLEKYNLDILNGVYSLAE